MRPRYWRTGSAGLASLQGGGWFGWGAGLACLQGDGAEVLRCWCGWTELGGADFGRAQMKKDVSGDTSSFQLVSQVLIRQP